jgi:phage terminase large subunit GpA-like protein
VTKHEYSNLEGAQQAIHAAKEFLRPPPDMTPSEWAEANIKIPLGNAIPGFIRFDNAPYQREPLDIFSDPTVERITLMWGAQLGKALDVDTPIPTETGFKPMGEVAVGDVVFDELGEPCNVTFVTGHQLGRKCYEVEFSDGSCIVADAEHLWTVDDMGYKVRGVLKPKRGITLTTEELIDGTLRANKQGRTRYAIPCAWPLRYQDSPLPIHPYVVGYWLGDGCKGSSYIISGKEDVDDLTRLFQFAGYSVDTRYRDSRNLNVATMSLYGPEHSLMLELREAQVTKEGIPDSYRTGSIGQRRLLLSGLLDSDGTTSTNGAAEFVNKRRWISELVYELVCSLGVKAVLKSVVKCCGESCGEYWQVTFKSYAADELFQLPRKRIKTDVQVARRWDSRVRRIKRITPVESRPVKCIQVDSPNRLYLAGKAHIPTHNTQLINCAAGYFIAHEPSSQMMMQPSQSDLNTWLETKFNPMVEANEVLNERIAKPRSREGVNNQKMKSYAGGFLMFSWSGSPNTMRGRSAPKIYCDEVDGYQYTAEGHPVNLLWQRAATFGDQRKLFLTSTPTIKGSSFIEKSHISGDMRKFWLPCPHCGEHVVLEWKAIVWQQDDEGEHLPDTALYYCQECGAGIDDAQKRTMLRKGEWRAERPFTGHASFHLSELYSPFRRWRDIVTSFLEKKHSGDVQSFVNVSLAETYEEEGESIDEYALSSRREPFDGKIPEEVVVLTAGVDVQDDRLEVTVIGWGKDDESYVIQHEELYGDPSTPSTWTSLDSILFAAYETHSGRQLAIRSSCVDSGGHNTKAVYDYAKKNAARRVFAIKGMGGEGKPVSGRPSKNNIGRCPLFPIGVDTIKTLLFQRMRIVDEGAGYIHFSDVLNDEYFLQLTAEQIVVKFHKGYQKREFKKMRPRNEALDCFVYAVAALTILNVNVNTLAQRLDSRQNSLDEDKNANAKTSKKPFVPVSRGRGGFAKNW